MEDRKKNDYSKTLNLPKTDFPMRGNLPENEPKIFKEVLDNDLYEKMLKKNENLLKDVLIVSKLEIQENKKWKNFNDSFEKMYVEHNRKFIINPGSLGCSRTLSADFVILKLENRKIIECTFKSIEYDRKKLLNDFEKQDVPDKELFEKEFFKLV